MNDRHPSGTVNSPATAPGAASAHHAPYGEQGSQYGDFTTYGGYPATGFHADGFGGHETGGYTPTTAFSTDPLFGDMTGGGSVPGADTGAYDTAQWATGSHGTAHYDPYAGQGAHPTSYETGGFDATAFTDPAGAADGTWQDAGHDHLSGIPAQTPGPEATGQWDAAAWSQAGPHEQTQQWEATQIFDSGAYDATAWNSAGPEPTLVQPQVPQEGFEPFDAAAHELPFDQQPTATFEQIAPDEHALAGEEFGDGAGAHGDTGPDAYAPADVAEVVTHTRAEERSAARSRSRRRPPARRSALFTVAVPSACVMGVAGIAAASVGGGGDESKETTASAADTKTVQPSTANNKLDTQLQNLSADVDDFADRASRTQERIDLKAQQELEKKKAAEEAARKERLRPKFALPVAQHGLSAYYGQAGINWMSAHTGIDFPVSYGTTVMAATDGTVRTQWNAAYGNMVIVTAKDGTETWYCHLSTYKVASGAAVKAGDPIAFSGNSGNSTGPHLHFEVRPAGGAAIDPLPWLRSHGLDPS
ncbi:peptidase [Streptomyces minutiscleroticus]|uniref:Peptidase n=1 Tax=Streptomyces minutiscleroticus TaxID=68238 RepID=A0A918NEX2_9ACTN|nr:M23 family metallopeptidase [Streptomyces minutiscleroticus]GGX67837.1 peptidase [Streptomyces minutiscleroticus]